MKGLGVIINELGGNSDTVKAVKKAIGKKIKKVAVIDNDLVMMFTDKTRLRLFDDGQCCCEIRYMNTDDDLEYFRGSIFKGAKIREGKTTEDKENCDVKESQFLIIETDKGEFTVVNYNEHNGYYSGFSISARHEIQEER